ncbi:MAG: bifunctional riboflavin kinase/FAD synthetase [Candidatus Methylomirabilia bacterium]
MEIIRGLESYPPDRGPTVVALGAFDGIHLAHQKILSTAVDRARSLDVQALACTFDPHPLKVLQPDRTWRAITTLEETLALMDAHGVDVGLVILFTEEFSRIEAETFVREVLSGQLKAREVVVGFNHTFGRGAKGGSELLHELGRRLGFVTHVIPPLMLDAVAVSSSAIREALSAGDARLARKFLGRSYSARGRVLKGRGRGRQLGFPTANLKPERELLLPAGVYACLASVEGEGPSGLGAVVNIGVRPTFGEGEYWVEAYLIKFSGDLYDRTLTLEFLERIRPERKFPDVGALRAQVARDIEVAGEILRSSPPSA